MYQQSIKSFFYVLLILLMISCKDHDEKGIISEHSYSLKDLAECELEIYIPSDSISEVLDTIINKITKCESYSNLPLAFIFESYKDSRNTRIVTISNIVDIQEFYYKQCSGLFYFQGYQFALIGDIIPKYFSSQKEMKKVYYISIDKIRNLKGRGEFFNSSWSYYYENGRLSNYHFVDCGRLWQNEENYSKKE